MASSTALLTIARGRGTHQLTDGIGSGHRRLSPRATFSRTVRDENSSTRWNERPRPERDRPAGPRDVTSRPCNITRPAEGLTRPEHALNVVVFPAPFGADQSRDARHGGGEAHVLSRHDAAVTDRQPTDLEPTGTRLDRGRAGHDPLARASSILLRGGGLHQGATHLLLGHRLLRPAAAETIEELAGLQRDGRCPAREDGIGCGGHTEEDLEVNGDIVRCEVAGMIDTPRAAMSAYQGSPRSR